MARVLSFGDVFEFAGEEYVYLAYAPGVNILYAAKVLNQGLSSQVQNLEAFASKKPGYARNLLYCFVVLSTPALEPRLAHFAKTGNENISVGKYVCTLTSDDIKALKQEILEGPLPEKLKDIIKETT